MDFPGLRTSSPPIQGRDHECAILDGLLKQVRDGRSGVLLLRGEPGIGKTALLQYLMATGSDLTLVRITGVESEMELPYAALHDLCSPILDGLGALPEPQQRCPRTFHGTEPRQVFGSARGARSVRRGLRTRAHAVRRR